MSRPDAVPVEELLSEALSSLRGVLAGRRVVLRIAPEVTHVLADAQWAGPAFRDLAVAASSGAPPGADLAVSAVLWGECVEIRIAGGARAEEPALARVRDAVAASGGDAWVEEAPGGGATFALRVPVGRA